MDANLNRHRPNSLASLAPSPPSANPPSAKPRSRNLEKKVILNRSNNFQPLAPPKKPRKFWMLLYNGLVERNAPTQKPLAKNQGLFSF